MSLCVVIQDKDRIVIGADSRESIRVGKEFYATGRYVNKTHIIGDQVIFSTGSSYVASAILNDYRVSGDYSIQNLEEIKNKRVNEFVNDHGEEFFGSGQELKHVVAFVVCSRRQGKSAIYALSSENRSITEIVDEPVRVADGSRCSEALKLLKEYQDLELLEAYQNIYNNLSDESIGGELTIHLIDRHGIRNITFPIIDSRKIRIAPQSLFWSREQGLVVEREDHVSKAVFNSDELTFYANGEKALWFDLPNRKFMFSGDLEAAGGTFSGTLQAVDGIFTGTLQGVDGTFTGTLEAGTIRGSDIYGSYIYGAEIEGGTVTGSTVMTDNVGNARVELRSGLADVVVSSGPSGNQSIFEIVDNYSQATLNFPNGGEIRAPSGILDIIVPGGVYINGVKIG